MSPFTNQLYYVPRVTKHSTILLAAGSFFFEESLARYARDPQVAGLTEQGVCPHFSYFNKTHSSS